MKVAFVLFGQPRDYINGFNNLASLISNHKDLEVDFFYHCWILNEGEVYTSSKNRYINPFFLEYKADIKKSLKSLYKPKAFEYEYSINEFDTTTYVDTLAYNFKININHNPGSLTNCVISQAYSRTKARNILSRLPTW
jgi:hypothetical protein